MQQNADFCSSEGGCLKDEACIDSSRHFVFRVARKSIPVRMRDLMGREGKGGERLACARFHETGAAVCYPMEHFLTLKQVLPNDLSSF